MILFENYRGFDVWDKIEAAQVTPDNIQVLAEITGGKVLEEPNGIPVALQMPNLFDIDMNSKTAVKLWDFIVKAPGAYSLWINEQFKHTFAKDS